MPQLVAFLECGLESCDVESAYVIRESMVIHLMKIIKAMIEVSRMRQGWQKEEEGHVTTSLMDFFMAMDLNHLRVRVNWLKLFEKVLY